MKRFTLRVAISTLVSGLILLSAASVITALYLGTRNAMYQTTYQMMGGICRSMGNRLTLRLEAVERLDTLIAELIGHGIIDPAREEDFTHFLARAVESNPSIALIDCGLPSGNKFQALRMPDGSVSLRLVHRTSRAVVSTWRHEHDAYRSTYRDSVESLEAGYDPRTRPWYVAGIQNGHPAWTEIYPSRAGLNYSHVNPVYGPKGNLVCVTAIDLRVEDLSQFLAGFKVGNTGKAFIIDKDYHVVAMPLPGDGRDVGPIVKRVDAGGRTEWALRDIRELDDPAIRRAVLRYLQAPLMQGRGYLSFREADVGRLLASFEPEPRYHFTFGVVVPEADILGHIKRDLQITILITAGCLLLALVVAYGISRAIARPLTMLSGEVDRIRRLDFADVPPVRTHILEVLLIDDSVQNMRKALRSFKKYVPSDLVTRLMHLQKEAVIEGEKRELTLFFSDIAGFTSISEQLSPEALVERLGSYFEAVTRILLEDAGTVDKFIGDAVMAFWGAPTPLADHAALACRAALRAQAAILDLNRRWAVEGGQPFETRMGIHTGEAVVGNIGFEGRMNYTAIGDSVNLASRLEGLNKFYGTRILVSGATLEAAGDAVLARMVDLVAVKGKARAIAIFELLALRAEAPPSLVEEAARSREAFELYRSRRWEEAIALLEAAPEGPCPAARVLIERCRRYREEPPEPGWDGVCHYHEK